MSAVLAFGNDLTHDCTTNGCLHSSTPRPQLQWTGCCRTSNKSSAPRGEALDPTPPRLAQCILFCHLCHTNAGLSNRYCLLYHLENHYCCIGGFRDRPAATYPGVNGATRPVTEFQYCAESQLPGGFSGLMWLTWYELVLSLVKFKKHTLMFVQKRVTSKV